LSTQHVWKSLPAQGGGGGVVEVVGGGVVVGEGVVDVSSIKTGIGAGSGSAAVVTGGVVVTTAVVFETVVDEQQPRAPNLTVPSPEIALFTEGSFVLRSFFSWSVTADGATVLAPRFVTLYCTEASVVPLRTTISVSNVG
jgi:hypothetical protein